MPPYTKSSFKVPTSTSASTPAVAVVTSAAVWEVIERRKREKAELQEAVDRKEVAAAREAVVEVTKTNTSRERERRGEDCTHCWG